MYESITDLIAAGGHEEVVFAGDRASGLRTIIAIHSTALGPSLGGIRFWPFTSERDALVDVLRLSAAMTLKAAAAGLYQGGGKAVVLCDSDRPRADALLDALGRVIDDLGGRYLAAEDVGATTRDMDGVARVTPWVTGVSERDGGSGDPSPVTAFGVVCAMHAVADRLWGDRSLAGRKVAVQGAGHVGRHLAGLLAEAGASVVIADVDARRAGAVARELGVEVLGCERVLVEQCDFLAPCALGGAITVDLVPHLRCAAVVGAANNQLAEPRVDDLLDRRGIVYAPDFVANAGGIVNIAEEFTGYDHERALARTAEIEVRTSRVLAESMARGEPPGRVAEAMARRRLEVDALPDGRWRPGDPAAWTDGRPLTRLRPA